MAVAGEQPPSWVLPDIGLPIGGDGGNDRSQFPGYGYLLFRRVEASHFLSAHVSYPRSRTGNNCSVALW